MIPWDLPLRKFKEMIESVDMLFFPGGGAPLVAKINDVLITVPYMNRLHTAFQIAKHINKVHGKYYPVLATCLGMEAMGISFANNDPSVLNSGFDDENTKHKVNVWIDNFNKSNYFDKKNRDKYREYLESGELYFHHNDGFTPRTFRDNKYLNQQFIVTSSAYTNQGVEFVSSIEHKTLPFYANLFHPEKTQYERSESYKFLNRNALITELISKNIMNFVQNIRSKNEKRERIFSDIPNRLLDYSSMRRIPEYIKGDYAYEKVFLFAQESKLSDKMYEIMVIIKAQNDEIKRLEALKKAEEPPSSAS